MYALVVHGGAGNWRPEKNERAVASMRVAAEVGRAVLAGGGSAEHAVVDAVAALEDDPLFNAGTGGGLNLDGAVEMDAALMIGSSLEAGAVANLVRVKNAIHVAQAVMRETDHVLLAGDGALRFARAFGFEDYDPVTPDRQAAFERNLKTLKDGNDDWLPRMRKLIERFPELTHGTVGAVALDSHGELVAGTSTAGVALKLAGRIGDSPILGAGTYATRFGAAGATGRGEIAMRTLATRSICDRIVGGASASEACRSYIDETAPALGREVGVIAVDRAGGVGVAHASDALPHAWVTEACAEVHAAMAVRSGLKRGGR